MNKNQRKRLRKLRNNAYYMQDGFCVYCDNKMILPDYIPGKRTTFLKKHATAEHVIPQSLGGEKIKYYNVLCSCLDCNSFRRTIDHDIFMKLRKRKDWKKVCNRIESIRTIGYYLYYKRRLTTWVGL